MNSRFNLKKVLIPIALLGCASGIFLIHSLAGLNSYPVVFAEPPAAFALFTDEIKNMAPTKIPSQLTQSYSEEEALLHQVFFDGKSIELIMERFAHSDSAKRIKMASAFANFNVQYSHDDESGYPERRKRFWQEVEQRIPILQQAFFEALIMSAVEETPNFIPYTLGWMPGPKSETVELFTWAAQHHSDWWVRRFSVYFVVKFGDNKEFASLLLRDRVNDPDYRVRKQVLELKFGKLTGQI